jgi:cytochrome c
MRNKILIITAIAALLATVWFFTQEKSQSQAAQSSAPSTIIPELSAAAQTGETYFNAKCAACHGINGAGTQKGPTFIHKVYQKGHHADESFQRAAKMGATAHHWNFGNMPPVTGITRAEVAKIITYIREIQAANGL